VICYMVKIAKSGDLGLILVFIIVILVVLRMWLFYFGCCIVVGKLQLVQ